jgi:glycosyltransferase involved in cell wall biosynthesis
MKILFVFTQFLPNMGGTELAMYYYAKELIKRGHEVTIFTANSVKLNPANLNEKEIIDGIIVRRFKFIPFPIYNQFFFSPALISALLSLEVDIIQIFSWIPSFFILTPFFIAKVRKIPVIFYPQCNPNRYHFYHSLVKRIFGLFMDKMLGPRILKKADYIIALTDTEARFYKRRGITNVEVIREPFQSIYYPSESELAKFKERYNIGKEDKVLLAVCRIVKYKGIHILIKSLSTLLKSIPNVRLLVVGEDYGFMSYCKKLAKELNCEKNISFTGRISDKELSCAYEIADVVVVPSFFESYGRVVTEAWAHHKPVIVTNMVGLAELVSKTRAGIIVKPNDPYSLTYALMNLLEDEMLAKIMGETGYQLLRKEITLDIAMAKLEKVYKDVLKK